MDELDSSQYNTSVFWHLFTQTLILCLILASQYGIIDKNIRGLIGMKKLFMLFLICFYFSFLFGGCETVTPEKVEPTANTTGESSSETNEGTGVDAPQTEVFDIGDVIEAKDMHYTVNSVREAPEKTSLNPKKAVSGM